MKKLTLSIALLLVSSSVFAKNVADLAEGAGRKSREAYEFVRGSSYDPKSPERAATRSFFLGISAALGNRMFGVNKKVGLGKDEFETLALLVGSAADGYLSGNYNVVARTVSGLAGLMAGQIGVEEYDKRVNPKLDQLRKKVSRLVEDSN